MLCSVQLIFAEDDPRRNPLRLKLESTYDETVLSKYDTDKGSLNIYGANPFFHFDARKIGPGTLVVEVTFGMLKVRKMTYLVDGGGKTSDLDIAEVSLESDEKAVQLKARLPGTWVQTVGGGDQASTMKAGESANKHLSKLIEKYGKATASKKMGPNGLTLAEVMKWKVGEGFLEIEVSVGAGIVDKITYLIGNEREAKSTRMKVNNVDLTKGEMTIVIPGHSDRQSLGKETGGKK
jgi:hypothetical protein